MTIAYVYKWTHIPTMHWYIGSRTAVNCHPNDGYICSSAIVNPLYNANPEEWIRQIIETGTPTDMRQLEAELLEMFDAMHDPRSFNQHNSNGKFTFKGGKPQTAQHIQKRAATLKGIPQSAARKKNISIANKGKIAHNKGKKMPFVAKSEEHSKNIAKALTGLKKSAEHIEKNKLCQLNRPKLNCPHCDKLISGAGNLKQHVNANHKEIK